MSTREDWIGYAHAMQSGVAMEIELRGLDDAAASPKHLRVGVNTAMADHAGLVRLLVEKGMFTEQEYMDAIAKSMKEEKERYERLLSKRLGKDIGLA
jgi:hypothetical protein